MNLYQISDLLLQIVEGSRSVFLKAEPTVPDFTIKSNFKLKIYNQKNSIEINVNNENITTIIGLFDATIFSKYYIDRLYVWNIKPIDSYFFSVTKKHINPKNMILDIMILENFYGIKNKAPENLNECIDRIRPIVVHKDWQSVYKAIHLPLALRVLPEIENNPVLNEENRRTEFPYYEIEGQINGRMNCLSKYSKNYLPHNMGPEVKAVLKPRGYESRFLSSDFKHCEVTVLQWLSKDKKLNNILESGKDLHNEIYEIITGDKCDNENKRKLSKKMFLPVMYGCGPKGLANNLGVTVNVSTELIHRIRSTFPDAWDWMVSKEQESKQGEIKDYFGRIRNFKENEFYLARNFSVQGVAATICQEKLIDLHKQLNYEKAYVIFSLHDGYGLVCKIKHARETYQLVKQVCESSSTLCPDLKMKVSIKFGAKLDKMKELWKD